MKKGIIFRSGYRMSGPLLLVSIGGTFLLQAVGLERIAEALAVVSYILLALIVALRFVERYGRLALRRK